MNELKLCPFCGGHASARECIDEHWVSCDRCEIGTALCDRPEDAVARWQARDNLAWDCGKNERLVADIEAILSLAARLEQPMSGLSNLDVVRRLREIARGEG